MDDYGWEIFSRYFILDGEYLGYLSAPGPADLAKKTFDLSKARYWRVYATFTLSNIFCVLVTWRRPSRKIPIALISISFIVSVSEGSLVVILVTDENVYYMRAPSVPEMRKWMNSMQIVIAAT